MIIRSAHPTDAEAIANIYGPVVASTVTSFEFEIPDVKEMAHRMAAGGNLWPWLVSEHEGTIQGYAYAAQHRTRAAYQWSVDVSVYIAETSRRMGVGTKLYSRLFELLTAQGYCNAFAGITLPNEGSVRLHESFGFQALGVYERVGFKQNAWRDVGWWQLRLSEIEAPAKIVPFTKLDIP